MRILHGFFAGSLGFLEDPASQQQGVPVDIEHEEPFTDQIWISSKTVNIIYNFYLIIKNRKPL